MRQLTGFDRVVIYAFKPDWSGEVVAEDCGNGLPRYLGLRFPASDIPSQARALYASCRLRMVPTSSYEPARIIGLAGERPLDLTHASLRSISPVHLEYMRNMGVTASLGISLMLGDRLWGLITCNHESGTRPLSHETRTACGLLGEVVSSLLDQKEGGAFAEARAAFLDTQAELVQRVVQDRDVVRGLTEHATSILDVTGSAGAALYYDGEVHCLGITPPRDAILELLAWIEQQTSPPLAIESLPESYAPALAWKDVCSGLLASSIVFADSEVVSRKSWLLWFRPEVIQTVSWGGDPNKPVNHAANDRLHPRKSFERWCEEVHHKCVPFQPADVAAATSLATALTDVILEIEAGRQIREHSLKLDASNAELRLQIEENQRVGRALQARTEQLHQRETSLQLVLDATGDGLISVALDGKLLGERSRAVEQWFDGISDQALIWNVLFPDDRTRAEEFELMWTQLASGGLPWVVSVDQMCRELTHAGRCFEIGYKEVREERELSSILVTLEDVTERAAARKAAAEASEAQTILAWVLRDARGLGRALAELSHLSHATRGATSPIDARRALHTLKGNAAVLGLVALPVRCHELEDRLAERIDGAKVLDDDMRAIDEELARVIARVHELAGEGAFERVEIPASELSAAIATLERGGPPSEVLCLLRRWTLEPVARPLSKLARRAQGLAQALGKNVEVVVVDRNVHLDASAFEPVWGALAHAVNNAVDHGIEPENVRTELGKPARGRIVLSAEDCGDGWVVIEVNDDGGGINLDAIRVAASRRGLPCSTRGQLLDALFADEVSARTEITSTSGRGVGLAALRATCEDLDGAVDLHTEEGTGTRLRLRVPRLGRSLDRRAA